MLTGPSTALSVVGSRSPGTSPVVSTPSGSVSVQGLGLWGPVLGPSAQKAPLVSSLQPTVPCELRSACLYFLAQVHFCPGPRLGVVTPPTLHCQPTTSQLSPASTHRLQVGSLLDPKPLLGVWHPRGQLSALAKPAGPSTRLSSVGVAPGELKAFGAKEPLFPQTSDLILRLSRHALCKESTIYYNCKTVLSSADGTNEVPRNKYFYDVPSGAGRGVEMWPPQAPLFHITAWGSVLLVGTLPVVQGLRICFPN